MTHSINEPIVAAPPQPVVVKSPWDVFCTALDEAISRVKPEYFRVPRFKDEAAWRERAYCYELYHQLRCQLPEDFAYTLHGEIDKMGHLEIIQHFPGMKRPNPDFVLHKPGKMGPGENLAVIEVKRSGASLGSIKQDLWKIRKFVDKVGYKHGIMLLFGEQAPPDGFRLGKIEAIWHNAAGKMPMRSNKGKFI